MKKQKIQCKEHADLELVCLIAGVLVIAGFVICLLDASAAPIFFVVMLGIGVILNLAAALLTFCRKKWAAGSFFAALSTGLLVLFFLQILEMGG